jgi:hypothetical protein
MSIMLFAFALKLLTMTPPYVVTITIAFGGTVNVVRRFGIDTLNDDDPIVSEPEPSWLNAF